MNDLLGRLNSEFISFILENEPQERQPHDDLIKANEGIKSRGHDSPISDDPRSSSDWLGRYHDMNSPGKITLHRDKLARSFWTCIFELELKHDTKDPAIRRILCQSMVHMVLAHERFHHFCDVTGRITGCRGGVDNDYKKDWKIEEALATAWEWQQVQRSLESAHTLPKSLREDWIDWWFGSITAAGYEDWRKYSHFCFFKEGLTKYLDKDDTISCLADGSVDPDDRLPAQLEVMPAIDSTITYWKATNDNDNPGKEIKLEGAVSTALASPAMQKWIEVSSMFCNENRKDLHNIHKQIGLFTKEMCKHDGIICLNGNLIKTDLLGLMMIDWVTRISLYGLKDDLLKAIIIINKHLGRGRQGVMDAQNELIDFGLSDFARL